MKRLFTVILAVLTLTACSPTPKTEEASATAEPTPEHETIIYAEQTSPIEIDIATQTETPSPTPNPTATLTPTWLDEGAETIMSDILYQSSDIKLELSVCRDETSFEYDVDYYVVDIWLKDIHLLGTSCAGDGFHHRYVGRVKDMAASANAVAAINGDYYGFYNNGVVLRNGVLYKSSLDGYEDICVLYYDGSMATYEADKVDFNELMTNDPWQIWNFGPSLLDENGVARSSFAADYSDLGSSNPRTAIGYFEPGHYCFVIVDGRSEDSMGLRLNELAELMQSLGCKVAYNLDGGQTSQLYWQGSIRNDPARGGRDTSDIIYIREEITLKPTL